MVNGIITLIFYAAAVIYTAPVSLGTSVFDLLMGEDGLVMSLYGLPGVILTCACFCHCSPCSGEIDVKHIDRNSKDHDILQLQ